MSNTWFNNYLSQCDCTEYYGESWLSTFQKVQAQCFQEECSIQTIEIGDTHTIAASDNGKIFAWGNNDFFQLGTPENPSISEFTVLPKNLKEKSILSRITSGPFHNYAIFINGMVKVWGKNDNGELGLGQTEDFDTPVANEELRANDIASNGKINIAITERQKVIMWPLKIHNKSLFYKPVELPMPASTKVEYVSLGADFAMLLSTSGTLFSFGKNSKGELGQGDYNERDVPNAVSYLAKEKISFVSCGFRHTIAKSSLGRCYTWGINTNGELANGNFSHSPFPIKVKRIKGNEKVLQAKAGFRSCIVLTESKKLYWWGTNGNISKQCEPLEIDIRVVSDQSFKDSFIPIRVLNSWSRSMSISYITVADHSLEKSQPFLKNKACTALSNKWEQSTSFTIVIAVEPPISDQFAKHFTTKSMKKCLPYKAEKKSTNSSNINLNSQEKIKISRVAMNSLSLQKKQELHDNYLFYNDEGANSLNQVKEVKERVLHLLRKRKSEFSDGDKNFLKSISNPEFIKILRKL